MSSGFVCQLQATFLEDTHIVLLLHYKNIGLDVSRSVVVSSAEFKLTSTASTKTISFLASINYFQSIPYVTLLFINFLIKSMYTSSNKPETNNSLTLILQSNWLTQGVYELRRVVKK